MKGHEEQGQGHDGQYLVSEGDFEEQNQCLIVTLKKKTLCKQRLL